MMNTSTGIEQFPWWEWERKGRLGTHRERAAVYDAYMSAHPDVARAREALTLKEQFTKSTHLPNWFVTATEMSPRDHAITQSAIQRHVDSSISKTCNLPQDFSVEDVGDFYRTMYESGCKGGTVYRDKCREEQVLNIPEEEKTIPEVRPCPEGVYDMKAFSVHTPVGKMNVKLGIHDDGEIFESWFDISKAGTTLNADREALARLVSLILRLDSPIDPKRRLNLVIDQLKGIGGRESHGFGPNRVDSVPDGIAKGLQKLLDAVEGAQKAAAVVEVVEVPGASERVSKGPSNGNGSNGNGHRQAMLGLDICPACHEASMYRSEGCSKCANCGNSRC